jgi:hypothetical protein
LETCTVTAPPPPPPPPPPSTRAHTTRARARTHTHIHTHTHTHTYAHTPHCQVLMALGDIKDLRGLLARAQRESADDDLHFLQLLCARDHAYALHSRLSTLHTVSQTPATIQLLLQTGDFVEALDLIATTQEIVRTELAGLHCLRHFSSQLKGTQRLTLRSNCLQ